MTGQGEYLMGMYDDIGTAERAVDKLHELGYTRDEISVVMSDKTKARDFAEHSDTKAAEGLATGAIVGGSIGAIVAAFTATGSIAAVVGTGGAALPFVAGPFAAALAGLGAGGAAGGLVGGLIGAGVPESRAKKYESRLEKGGILVGVKPRIEHYEQVRGIFPDDELEP